MAAVPPSPVEIKVTKARSTGANRMDGSCSEFDSDRQIKRREPDVRSRRCYIRGKDTKMWRTKWMLTLLLVAGVLFGIKPPNTFPQGAGNDTAVFSGGCFWGVDAVFKHVKGVTKVVSGYAGGAADTAHYEIVSTGTTGHAESVQVTYDPSKVSYDDLLKVFFFVAHDPTQLNRQFPDEGTQYRSEIFYTSDEQKRIAEAYIQQLNAAKVFHGPIVTKVAPLQAFYP